MQISDTEIAILHRINYLFFIYLFTALPISNATASHPQVAFTQTNYKCFNFGKLKTFYFQLSMLSGFYNKIPVYIFSSLKKKTLKKLKRSSNNKVLLSMVKKTVFYFKHCLNGLFEFNKRLPD